MKLVDLAEVAVAENASKLALRESALYDAVGKEKARAVRTAETANPLTLGFQVR
jgi:hypothetical protein